MPRQNLENLNETRGGTQVPFPVPPRPFPPPLTGARVGEVRTARFEQFNLDYVIWSKPAATTKQRKIHRVPISQEVVSIVCQRQLVVPRAHLRVEQAPIIAWNDCPSSRGTRIVLVGSSIPGREGCSPKLRIGINGY